MNTRTNTKFNKYYEDAFQISISTHTYGDKKGENEIEKRNLPKLIGFVI